MEKQVKQPTEQYPLLYTYGDRVVIDKYVQHKSGGGGVITSRNIPTMVTDRIPISASLDDRVSVNLYMSVSGAPTKKGMGKQGKDLPAIHGGIIQIIYSATLGNIKGAAEKLIKMRQQYGLPIE